METRSAARRAIEEQRVRVRGVAVPRPSTLISSGTDVFLVASQQAWASRAGNKLAAALEAFAIDVPGRRALDVGASTGGFTDVLLQRGSASVTAVDVGYGQMIWRLRRDPRVTVRDRTNFRLADPADLGAPFDLVVVDVSFISVALLTDNLAACGHQTTDYVILVKPQFEVGKGQVGRGGVVTDPSLHLEAVQTVVEGLRAAGLGTVAAIPSPITGGKGNREFLLHARPGAGVPSALDGLVRL